MNKFYRTIGFAVCLAAVAFAQGKEGGTLRGRVLLEDGQPAAGAMLEFFPIGTRNGVDDQRVQCDETGSFELNGLAAGSYRLRAIAPGYVTDEAMRIYRTGETISLHLVKGGVITGRVTDETGEPLVGLSVMLQPLRDAGGKPARLAEFAFWGNDVRTDDRGIYRAYGLRPGGYIVGVQPRSDWGPNANMPEVPTYHPSTARDAAAEITVRAGEEVANIDIRHRGEPGHAVSGKIAESAETSRPDAGAQLILLNALTRETIAFTYAGSNNPSKSFVFFGIPDGDYELYARMQSREEDEAGSPPQRLTVKGADVTGLTLRLAAYGALSGRVLLDPAKPGDAKCEGRAALSVEEVLLRPQSELRNPRTLNALLSRAQDDDYESFAPNEKGEFTLRGLEADSYRIIANLPGDAWYVRAITRPQAASRTPTAGAPQKMDLSRSPINLKPGEKLSGIEILLAEGAASLAGKVLAARDGRKLPPRLQVHLIPAEVADAENLLRYAETSAERDGAFAFKQLAPGKYRLLVRPAVEAENKLPTAFDAAERAKLRREAEAAKHEIELKPCDRRSADVPSAPQR